MPTGYTAGVQDGTVTTLDDYVWTCARAFGALITLRDTPTDGKKPRPFEVESYYLERVQEARDEVAKYVAMTLDEAEAAQADETRTEVGYHEAALAEALAQRQRYERMLALVETWKPPTPDHVGMREFMESQLRDSIEFDCGISDRENYHVRWLRDHADQKPQSVQQWWTEKRRGAQKELDRACERLDDETKRVESRNQWVRDLEKSLAK